MNRLVRTRSQHFVASPRKIGSPLKHKHSSGRLHATKRRRVGSGTTSGLAVSHVAPSPPVSDDESTVDITSGSSRASRTSHPLDSDSGAHRANRGVKARGKSKAVVIDDVFGSDESSLSPRKRKRGEGIRATDGSDDTGDSGSWVEMDEDEDEPEFIVESDQQLLADAPTYALHRLRKAELIRLWKVAGMWNEEEMRSHEDQEEGADLGKKELVDGLIAARHPISTRISPVSSPRASPRRRTTLESAIDIKRLRSSSSLAHSPISSKTNSKDVPNDVSRPLRTLRLDPDATPRANPRTRSKVRTRPDGTPIRTRTVPRHRSEKRNGVYGQRRRSMVDAGAERKARFGDVKSPANGLLRRPRRLSAQSSSTCTTTDSSPPEKPRLTTGRLSKRRMSRSRPEAEETQSLSRSQSHSETEFEDDIEQHDDDDTEPTPLVARLRSRTKSFQEPPPSEIEADDEDEGSDGDNAYASPVARGQRRNTSRGDRMLEANGDSKRLDLSRGDSRLLPKRSARRKALQAIRANGEDSSEQEGMEVDVAEDDDEDEGIVWDEPEDMDESRPTTRSMQRGHQGSPRSRSKPARRSSRHSVIDIDVEQSTEEMLAPDSPLTPAPPSMSMEVDQEEDEMAVEDNDAESRTTRSGRAFGTYQSRRTRLRQEAMDDPDMAELEGVDEDEEEDEDEFEADYDLADATVSSLTRLLRDELVQLCEARGIEVGGTKPQLAKALIEWRDEQAAPKSSSSTATARPSGSSRSHRRKHSHSSRRRVDTGEIIHAVASNRHVSGKTTPVLLRDHVHAHDPATPPVESHTRGKGKGQSADDREDIATARPRGGSDEDAADETSKRTANGETELNLDLAELGLEDSMIKPEHLVKLERIGSGGFKDVYVGKLRGRRVAVSEFRGHLSEMDIRELKLLAEFSHPNIVKFRGISIPEDSSQVPCMLVSELCENGDLFDYIRNVDPPPLRRILGLMLDIARGLEYLHTRKPAIIHRDCKSSNILINRAGQGKVGDFGLARVKTSTRSMIRSLVGTVNWQAPELWHPQPRYDYKVDVFSAGMVYWEMLSGWGTSEKKYPWEGHNEHYIYDAVGQRLKRPSVAGLRKAWGAEPVNLMERMWHQDPAERPTMSDVVADLEAMIAECKKTD